MYHHHSQQQGSQPFSNGPRPPHHQPPPNQPQNRPGSDMLSQAMGFQFPRPTQLPDELESALAIRGARDMDHRLIDHVSRPNQLQNQSSASGISQHGNFGSNSVTLNSDNQQGHQQGVDWSSYQPPTKLFASTPPSASHQPQRRQGPQQQPQSRHVGTNIPSWTAPTSDKASTQVRHPHGGGDGQSLYTPESAGSILASFGLSNEDLEVLSHYPDDQLTPDTLPLILLDIQINKSGNQKTVASSSASSFSHTIHDVPLPPSRSSPLERSHSPEVPSLLTVTQTAGKVIDYGHSSRAKDDSGTRETFKREQLSSERIVKMYPSTSSTSSPPKTDKAERRQVRLEHTESSKHGDKDYRRTSSDHHKSNRSPGREFPPSSKSRNLDRDYRHDRPRPRSSSETRSESSSRRSLSSSSGSKPHSNSKKLPTPTMISDFSAVSPKVYPHTCSLCHIQCDQEKDWVEHINTVNHTAACRDLRNKYPDWKPDLPSRSGRYGSRTSWDHKDHSPSHSVPRSLSRSPTPSPPHGKHRAGPHHHQSHVRPYLPHHHPRHQHYTGGSLRGGVKRPHEGSSDTGRRLSSSKASHSSKHGPLQSSKSTVKTVAKPGAKTTKMASAKATDTSAKLPVAKKKKKTGTPAAQDSSVADRLVYLTGIPKDASEQEVTDLVGSFGKINNVILMPCSEEESEKGEGQKASVCMVKAEHAQALANCADLSIREQQITASLAKKPEAAPDAHSSKHASEQDKGAAGDDSGGEADHKTSDEKGTVLISGLPESGWSESDIIKLVQPFGAPSDVILAAQIGKVLVSVPDMEIAEELVKVHTFIPMKIKDTELKMTHLKQSIGLSTPVALYNLLMGPMDPLECGTPVGWSSLLVISNVPNTPSGSSEVQKLVRRFGTVIKTLVLNTMVICEMATAAMALSVYKRFQTFPCIIQNNPLFFSRKPDPKVIAQTKVVPAYCDSSEDTNANGKGGRTAAAADKEEAAHKKIPETQTSEAMEKDVDRKDKNVTSTEKAASEDQASRENDGKDKTKEERKTYDVCDSSVAPSIKLEADVETDVKETSAENVIETTAEKKGVEAPKAEVDSTPASEDAKPCSSDGRPVAKESAMPELPKVTQEMVKALLVECRTRNSNHPNDTTAPTNGEQAETQMETDQTEKAAEGTKEPDKNHAVEEVKKQERERKEREARKEKEVKERERKERERRAWEKEERNKREREKNERARREREKRERERREWERRERERKERKRAYGEGLTGLRSSYRSEGYKQSSWRDEQYNNPETGTKTVEEEEFDGFPFNMSDFVTVDEVGDVTDLPHSPSPTVPMETTEQREDGPASDQKDNSEDTPMDITTEAGMSDATATVVKPDENILESEPMFAAAAETSDGLVSSDITAGVMLSAVGEGNEGSTPASQSDPSPSQTPVLTCQPGTQETEAPLAATQDSTTEAEHPPTPAASAVPADCSSNSPATQIMTAEIKEEQEEDSALTSCQAKEEEKMVVSDSAEEHEKVQDKANKETGAPAVESGQNGRSEDQQDTTEKSGKKEVKIETPMGTECSLPPYNPSNPLGMEFLVPKTGFFCKVCNRFFSGTKEAEINHCKTLKHYENLQKYLQTKKMANVSTKLESS